MALKERAVKRKEIVQDYTDFNRDEQRHVEKSFARAREIGGAYGGGLDPRRRQEVADGGLVREDLTQIANLPRMAQHHEFPQEGYYMNPYLDDTRLEGANMDLLNKDRFKLKLRIEV